MVWLVKTGREFSSTFGMKVCGELKKCFNASFCARLTGVVIGCSLLLDISWNGTEFCGVGCSPM